LSCPSHHIRMVLEASGNWINQPLHSPPLNQDRLYSDFNTNLESESTSTSTSTFESDSDSETEYDPESSVESDNESNHERERERETNDSDVTAPPPSVHAVSLCLVREGVTYQDLVEYILGTEWDEYEYPDLLEVRFRCIINRAFHYHEHWYRQQQQLPNTDQLVTNMNWVDQLPPMHHVPPYTGTSTNTNGLERTG